MKMKLPESLHSGLKPALFLSLGGLFLLLACSAPSTGGGPAGTQTAPAAQATKPPASAAGSTQPAPTTASAPTGSAKASASASAATLDACTLLTKPEVEAAIGAPVKDPEKQALGPMVACTFQDPTNPIITVASVTVFIGADAKEAASIHELGKRDGQAVAGLGDDAYLGPFGNLEVLKGKYSVSVSVVSTSEGTDRLSVAKSLASKALARLP